MRVFPAPRVDPMRGRRFDGVDRPDDWWVSHGGPCACGAPEGEEHLHGPPARSDGDIRRSVRESLQRMAYTAETQAYKERKALWEMQRKAALAVLAGHGTLPIVTLLPGHGAGTSK